MIKSAFGTSRKFIIAAAGAIALLTGCGGGGGGGSTALPATSSGTGNGSETLSFTVNNPVSVSGDSRKTQSVSSSIKGLAVYAYAASGTMPTTPTLVGDLSLTPSAGNTSLCVASGGSRVCNVTFTAPVGADVVFLKLYDSEPSGGAIPSSANVLASGSGTLTVNTNGTNSTTITLNSTAPFAVGTTAMLAPTASGSISSGSVSFALPSGTPANVQANVSEVLQLLLPLSTQRKPQFVEGAGNTEIWAFGLNLSPTSTTLPSPGMTLNGTSFVLTGSLASTFAAATTGTLSVALYNGSGYTDVGYMTYSYNTTTSTLTITGDILLLSGETGITQTGVYVVYLPPSRSTVPLPAANSITVAFPQTSFYPTTGAQDGASLDYFVWGNSTSITVTVTSYDSSGNAISGNLSSPITLTNTNSTLFSLTTNTISTSPGTVTLNYNGRFNEGSTTTIGTSTSGITVNTVPNPPTIGVHCLNSNSYYEAGGDDNTTMDQNEDSLVGPSCG